MGRPRKYASDAERQAAHRARYAIRPCRFPKDTDQTLQKIADTLGVPVTEVVHSAVKFALLNRNWLQLGLFGKQLPHADSEGQP